MKQTKIKRINKVTAVQKALENLREYIKNTDNEILPSESELSNFLGISRLTVREAITVLEREGLVSRVQGKGTLINSFITKLENRIDFGCDIEGCLSDNGYDVKFEIIDFQFRKAEKHEQHKLELNEGDVILEVKKILYANGEVAAVYIDRIPEKLFEIKDFSREDFEPSIFPIVENLCQCNITHDAVHIYSSNADEKLANLFNVPVNTSLLRLEVFEYTSKGTAIMFNTEYYTNKFIRFTLSRNVAYKA
jgi:GntR family transcriptional regulator